MIKISPQQQALIENNPLAFATVNKDGSPNVIAVACVKVVHKHDLLITDNFMKHTVGNLKANNSVALVVWNSDWKGLKINGTANYYSDGPWLEKVKDLEDNKDLPAKGAILISITDIKKIG